MRYIDRQISKGYYEDTFCWYREFSAQWYICLLTNNYIVQNFTTPILAWKLS